MRVVHPVLGRVLQPPGKARGSSWSPALLFSSGAQGTWFDPADFSTLYQDSAGTTPVTATGQPVGMLLDKSQGTALGAELVAVSFSASTGWTFAQVGTTSGVASVAGGALSLPRVDASNFAEGGLSVATVIGRTYQVRWTTGAGGTVQIRAGGAVGNAAAGAANLAANTSGTFAFTATTNPQVISFVPQTDASTATVTAASVKNLAGNHAVQATATSRPTLQQDASGYYYLNFDGVDDGLATTAINFSTTSKAGVLAGLTKLSDAAGGVVVDLNTGGASTFRFLAPGNASANFQWNLVDSGSVVTVGRATFAAPTSNVVTGRYDLSAATTSTQVTARVNGAAQTLTYTSGPTTTAGNFVNQPLYLGKSSAGTLPFNGRLYGLVVVGAAQSATDIALAERFIGSRMGIAL